MCYHNLSVTYSLYRDYELALTLASTRCIAKRGDTRVSLLMDTSSLSLASNFLYQTKRAMPVP